MPARCASVLLHMASPREPGAWTALAELSGIGMTLVLATLIGLAGGYFADRWLGTKPWLTMIGLGLGIAAGFVNLFRSVNKAERDLDDSK
jgi:ATP synthase protein I